MSARRSTAPEKESANPPPPVPDTDLRDYEYDNRDEVLFQWMHGGSEAFIIIDDQHVVAGEDWA